QSVYHQSIRYFIVASKLYFTILNSNSGKILHALQYRATALADVIRYRVRFLSRRLSISVCLPSINTLLYRCL
ncbi:hypothetical protein, partial [Chryseobacterium sp. CH25]|uniref:hypothetical protein n=1 Tax=Chryseobacterium sp. CH25 TaxID=713559 RepID=UPI0013E92E8E